MAHQNHYAMKASGKSQRSIFTHRSGRNTGVSVLLALCAMIKLTFNPFHSKRISLKLTLIFLLILFPQICVASLKTETIHLEFCQDDFTFDYDDNGNLVIGTRGFYCYPEANEPGLPQTTVSVAFPGGYTLLSLNPEYRKQVLMTDVIVAPSPLPVPTSEIYTEAVSRDADYEVRKYPETLCCSAGSTDWSNATVLHFKISPFEYDAESKTLYLVTSIDVAVTATDETQIKKTNSSEMIYNPCPDIDMIKSMVVNPAAVDNFFESESMLKSQRVAPYERVDYLIVTSQALESAFEPLLKWKKTKGVYSKIITMEEVESQYSGDDSAHRLKRCLYDYCVNNGLKYVLLGGDDSVVPVRGCYGKVDKNIDFTIPADLYYACFGGDFKWDMNGNGIFGETDDNINFAPSLYITRLPVRTSEDINAYIYKLFNYEKNPIWTNSLLTGGSSLGLNLLDNPDLPYRQSDSEAKGDILYKNTIQPLWSGNRYKFYDTYTDFPGGASYEANGVNLSEQISKGYSFIEWISHGDTKQLKLESNTFYDRNHADNQINVSYTIFTTCACLTNAFDKDIYEPCLSEILIRNPNSGIIGYYGCSRYGWGIHEKGTSDPSLDYEISFYGTLFSSTEIDKNFGKIVALSKCANASSLIISNIMRWLQFGLNPIGDPEMPIFISTPNYFDNIYYSSENGKLILNIGVDGCRVCVMSLLDIGESYYKVYENCRSLSLTDVPVEYTLCITKQGYVPKLYKIIVDANNLVCIQDQTLTGNNVLKYNKITLGNDVTDKAEIGPVIIQKGVTTINAESVTLDRGFSVEKGAEMNINVK